MTPRSRHAAGGLARWRRRLDRHAWRVVALAVFGVAGALFVTSSLDADGLDLRASSVTDLHTVVRQQRERVEDLQRQATVLDREVGTLSAQVDDAEVDQVLAQADKLKSAAGYQAVRGPAVTVVLTDAPKADIDQAVEAGLDRDELVVHQQDIQAVVNALWSGGADAMTLQGQRVISTTGIKCVGNTVVLHDQSYAPPYEITAVGDIGRLLGALNASDYVAGYRTYVDAHHLGYDVSTHSEVTVPAYDLTSELRYAETTGPGTQPGNG